MQDPRPSAVSIRSRMAAASSRIARLRRIDRAAVLVITLGGIAVVVAVLGILVFVASEAIPLFRAARVARIGQTQIATSVQPGDATAGLRAVGVDEYRKYLYTIEPGGRVAFFRVESGERAHDFPIPGLEPAIVTSSSVTVSGHHLAAGLSDGRASLMQVQYEPQYEGQTLKDLSIALKPGATIVVDPRKRALRQISYIEQDGQRFVAGLVGDNEIAYAWHDGSADKQVQLQVPHRIRQIRIGRNGALLAGTEAGVVYHWQIDAEPRLTDASPVSRSPITALEWMLGGNSWIAAAEDGSASAWLRAQVGEGLEGMARAHVFAPQAAPIVGIGLSARERSFATAGRDGQIVLRHLTSERVLATIPAAGPVTALVISPKADALLALEGTRLDRYALDNPHPEISLRTLFGRVWYEGYSQPEYVWQSTGASDEVEPKFSLVPLVFGTIKGTVYAMLFAIPLAVLAALYTSQFVDPALRAKIKPTVEIMAALPSVVIGFLAGLYLASLVERHLLTVLMMFALLPMFGTGGVFLWRLLPRRFTRTVKPGTELALIVPLLLVGGWVAALLSPGAEAQFFGGDIRAWLQNTWGLTYDQRNCLVVGIAMGFAVIPIIFTISEDAFSSVPSSLTAASLALGASRWQTAVRVVLPTASPGVFSAIMVGFGRAVGETMIVLMATGNTPVMDWSLFNGIRTLSANIAVEIPEAPYGGTLYRTLFLAAALLFVMTFIVNTIAEIIRQRLRDRYKAI
jgi:phosphate transport system permease protein